MMRERELRRLASHLERALAYGELGEYIMR